MSFSPTSRATPDPWETYGWMAQSIWLLFLVFPIISVSRADVGTPGRVSGYVLIAVFAIIYVAAAQVLDRRERACKPFYSRGAICTAALVLIGVLLSTLIGYEAFGLAPFVVSFAMFILPLIWSLLVGGAVVIATWAMGLSQGFEDGTWVIGIIVLSVGVMTAAIRVVVERSKEHDALTNQLSVVAERERVARDVHDVLGHSLTALTVKAELAERLLDVDIERARAEIRQLQDVSRTALAEIRATVGGLRVARLDDELETARDALRSKGIAALLPTDISVVDPRHRILFAWVLREAVTNVIRHSGAEHCTVELDTNRIAITDDGTGLTQRALGNGLRGLRERVAAAHGTMTIEPAEPTGTRLEVTV